MMESTSEIMDKGMKEKFDYTKWQRDYFDAKTPMEIGEEASRFEKEHPFTGDAIRLQWQAKPMDVWAIVFSPKAGIDKEWALTQTDNNSRFDQGEERMYKDSETIRNFKRSQRKICSDKSYVNG